MVNLVNNIIVKLDACVAGTWLLLFLTRKKVWCICLIPVIVENDHIIEIKMNIAYTTN